MLTIKHDDEPGSARAEFGFKLDFDDSDAPVVRLHHYVLRVRDGHRWTTAKHWSRAEHPAHLQPTVPPSVQVKLNARLVKSLRCDLVAPPRHVMSSLGTPLPDN